MLATSAVPLCSVAARMTAEVENVIGEPAAVERLAALGVRAGSRVRIIRAGTSCLVDVAGSRLSLRCDSGMKILVRPILLSSSDRCEPVT